MFDEIFYKHSGGDPIYPMDFSAELPSGETISSQTVTAVDSAGADASSTVVSTISVSGGVVSAILQAGVDLQDYRVTFTANFSGGESIVKVLLLKVRDNRIG